MFCSTCWRSIFAHRGHTSRPPQRRCLLPRSRDSLFFFGLPVPLRCHLWVVVSQIVAGAKCSATGIGAAPAYEQLTTVACHLCGCSVLRLTLLHHTFLLL